MKRARRSFLRSAGGILLAAAVPAAVSRTAPSSISLPPFRLPDVVPPPEWSFRMHFAEWTGRSADIQSLCLDGAVPLAEEFITIMREQLDGRARVGPPPINDPPAAVKLQFVRYGANGHLLLLDIDLDTTYGAVVHPGNRVAADLGWLEAGMSFEVWLIRAITGSFTVSFPMNVGLADLICAIAYPEDFNDEREVCAISLGRILHGNTGAAMHEAQHDATQTLAHLGYPFVDGFFITFHGPHMDDAFCDLASDRFAEIADDQACILGQDWDETLPTPFVSVIAHGMRHPGRHS